jgi:tRNA (adenine37-N6)-methyltransferase
MQRLWIDTSAGISADRFAAAMLAAQPIEIAPILQVIKTAAESGALDVHAHVERLPDQRLAHRLHILPPTHRPATSGNSESAAPCSLAALEKALSLAGVEGAYAAFARRTLDILNAAQPQETPAPAVAEEPAAPAMDTVTLSPVGIAHTPYHTAAPYQPQPENAEDGAFYIQVAPEYASGARALETFSHIFVLSYLDRVDDSEVTVRPPWKDDSERYGVFATRSPNRPSPIGLTRVRLVRVEDDRIVTGPLDLFDGTPVLDIKPFIRTLDGYTDRADVGNDGWLEGSSHLELHRMGVPHEHPQTTTNPQRQRPSPTQPAGGASTAEACLVNISLLAGIAWGLQRLAADLSAAVCTAPVRISAEEEPESRAQVILDAHHIPYEADAEMPALLTPLGAAILAALAPAFVAAEDTPQNPEMSGLGLGRQNLDAAPSFGALRILTQH